MKSELENKKQRYGQFSICSRFDSMVNASNITTSEIDVHAVKGRFPYICKRFPSCTHDNGWRLSASGSIYESLISIVVD